MSSASQPESIAIIGMAGRFPQAATLEEFWSHLREGRESVTFFAPPETQWLPVEHPPRHDDPAFVRARAAVDRPEWFDAEFFRLKPQEAAIMDPQQRVFLECAWEALEHAGCNPDTFPGAIGVFAGAGFNSYLFNNLLTNPELIANYGLFPVLTLNEKDYLATRVAYKLNLRGPAVSVQTACSTSLVAVALACQQLLDCQCDLALAGGVSIAFPTNRGHHHTEGGIMSRDGRCRPFDAQATGTVVGNGAGIVVLKRFSEALDAGDRIWAVIKGHAINNDGATKMGFTAPSVDGQAECIAMAQAMAALEPGAISYVEAHGTGTPLGDPIEMAALAKAFRAAPENGGFCAVGSLKSNIGHLDVAAGVAGLIKVTHALKHGEIPPSLHFETLNPQIDFSDQRFFVNRQLRPWPRNGSPRRAGVSSFGIGGTNAHLVVEEAPAVRPGTPSLGHQLLLLSARTPTALDTAAANLASHLERHPELPLADVAYTLQTGRKAFEHRRAVVVRDSGDAVAALRTSASARWFDGRPAVSPAEVVFMFPGQGAQAAGAGRELLASQPEFRRHIDEACALANRLLAGVDLREILFPSPSAESRAAQLLCETRITQPALFVLEYALARLWMQWGVQPAAMIGHSLGEYVAACLAGVFTLQEAITLVVERGRLMQAQPPGAMLAVRLPEPELGPWLNDQLALAALNAPVSAVVSGPPEAIADLEKKLAVASIPARRLATSHAFHSAMMDPVLPEFAQVLRRVTLRAPKIRWASNVSGEWITTAQATSPKYWLEHVRHTVRFSAGLGTIASEGPRVLLEVGPGNTLAHLARQNPATAPFAVTATLGSNATDAAAAVLRALGELWTAGVDPAWRTGFHAGETRHVVALPTYPFERKRHWIEPGSQRWLAAPDQASRERAAVPEPPVATPEATRPPQAADTVDILKTAFAELSGLDLAQVKADTTFHQLGFDSLFLSQASVTLGRRFGVTLPFRLLRDELGTFARLAQHIDRQRAGNAGARAIPECRADAPTLESDSRLPLTDAQREIWMACQLGPAAAAAYHECARLELSGAVDVPGLQRAIDALVRRHEALRTTFAAHGAEQIIAPAATVELAIFDFSSADRLLSQSESAQQGERCIAEALERPFDLARGPLLRPVLARLDADHAIFALIVHHIACDGWSLGILVRELVQLYEDGARQLDPAPRFSDYVRAHGAQGESPPAEHERYWDQVFAEGAPVLDLPTDRPHPFSRSYAGSLVTHLFAPDLTAALQRFSAEHGSTVFNTLLAAFGVLLHRLTGQHDLVIGVPAAGQALASTPDLVGHFANLLPIRSRVTARQSFHDYHLAMCDAVSGALVHGAYPFVKLLQHLKIPRDASRVPLVPVLFNMVHHRGVLPFGPATATAALQEKRFVNFDLNLNLARTGNTYSIGCYYNAELFDAATPRRWLGHFEVLLRALLEQPTTPVTEAPLLDDDTRRMLLIDWNQARLEYPRDACIHEQFELQARQTPDAIAVAGAGGRLTFAELNRRADAWVPCLRRVGTGPDGLVGLLLDRTARLPACMLAVLKAGGAYVPLDASHPAHRIELIVADTEMTVVMTERHLLPLLPQGIAHVILVDEEPDDLQEGVDAAPAARPTAEHLAYVIHTSGSMGQPKGVCVPHRGVVALTAWARQQYKPHELAGVLFATSATFDVSVFECLVTLCLGGTVVIAENLLQLPRVAEKNHVTLISGVPSAIAELVRLRQIPSTVRTVNLAGEACPQSLVDALYALPHIERVFDLYGPTETTVYSTGVLRERRGRATIGRPLPNEQIYILDSHLSPVPIGMRGEIYIGGDKLARGYLRRPALTDYNFVTVPALSTGRLYRTGDAARFLPDGSIEYLGRIDRQVKIRGYRVELAEVEAVLARHPAVNEAAALVHVPPNASPQLVAYVVKAAGQEVSPADLRQHALQWLPTPMVPTAIMLLDRMPRTSSGKVDRGSLPKPVFGTANPTSAPTTPAERFLADVWREVLGVESVGVDDNFFALGGHSLHALQVLSRLQAAFSMQLTLGDFLSAPTIATLAPTVDRALLIGTPGLKPEPPDFTPAPTDPADAEIPAQTTRASRFTAASETARG